MTANKNNDKTYYDNLITKGKTTKVVAITVVIVLILSGLLAFANQIIEFGSKLFSSEKMDNYQELVLDSTNTIDLNYLGSDDVDTIFSCRRSSCAVFTVPRDWLEIYDHTVVGNFNEYRHPQFSKCRISCESSIECGYGDYNDTIDCTYMACSYNCWIRNVENRRIRNINELRIIESYEVTVKNFYLVDSTDSFGSEIERDHLDPPFFAKRYVIEYKEGKTNMKAMILSKYCTGSGHLLIVAYPKLFMDEMDRFATFIIDNAYFVSEEYLYEEYQ